MLIISSFSWITQAQITNKGLAYLSPNTTYSALYDFENQEEAAFYNDGKAYFYKNFTNNGVFDFYENSGKTWFKGEELQKLTGAEPGYFYQLIFDNQSQMTPFQLSGVFHIHQSAEFSSGIVNNRNYGGKIIFENSAIALNTSDQSYVDGKVEKRGGADFTYPIGQEGFYRLTKTTNAEMNNYTAIYFYDNSNAEFPHQQKEESIFSINNREYWELTRLEQEGEQILVTLSYHNMATPQDFIEAAEQDALVIVRWDENQQKWKNKGGSINTEEKSITTNVRNLGIFSLGKTENEKEEEKCEVEAFNLVDLKGTTNNKYLRFESDCAENYSVQVFNRWGVKVFETDYYGTSGDVFDGYSSGRLTVSKKDHLPTGTYYYILNYRNIKTAKINQKIGYVYIEG